MKAQIFAFLLFFSISQVLLGEQLFVAAGNFLENENKESGFSIEGEMLLSPSFFSIKQISGEWRYYENCGASGFFDYPIEWRRKIPEKAVNLQELKKGMDRESVFKIIPLESMSVPNLAGTDQLTYQSGILFVILGEKKEMMKILLFWGKERLKFVVYQKILKMDHLVVVNKGVRAVSSSVIYIGDDAREKKNQYEAISSTIKPDKLLFSAKVLGLRDDVEVVNIGKWSFINKDFKKKDVENCRSYFSLRSKLSIPDLRIQPYDGSNVSIWDSLTKVDGNFCLKRILTIHRDDGKLIWIQFLEYEF